MNLDPAFPHSLTGLVLALLIAVGTTGARAEDSSSPAEAASPPEANAPADPAPESSPFPPNVDSPTFGGKQFWTDELVFHDWRIQRNAITGHCRLVDDENVRRAWGNYDHCAEAFARARQERQLPPLKSQVVIVLHGLVRSRESMDPMVTFLRQHDHFSVLNMSYASTRGRVSDHAHALARVLEGLEGVQKVHFVAHSLGNLVVRHYLHDREKGIHDERPAPEVGRIVMLAPPNQGAEMARRFQDNSLFRTVWGASGRQLATEWGELVEQLAIPPTEFGIIAGGQGDEDGRNPLVAGDDDLVVSVAETKLPGAADFLICPSYHGQIMESEFVQKCTLTFLKNGFFVASDDRHPIPREHAGE